jgi:hypothetical protein
MKEIAVETTHLFGTVLTPKHVELFQGVEVRGLDGYVLGFCKY